VSALSEKQNALKAAVAARAVAEARAGDADAVASEYARSNAELQSDLRRVLTLRAREATTPTPPSTSKAVAATAAAKTTTTMTSSTTAAAAGGAQMRTPQAMWFKRVSV
jgi:hypothetical protein